MADRIGDWTQTYTGRKFYPQDPRPEDIDIKDIARALSLTNRFGGHTQFAYSVAQHSILVASKASPANALRALMHDATEAYLGDIPRPIKRAPQMAGYAEMEAAVERAICARFDLPCPLVNDEIDSLDHRILVDERDFLFCDIAPGWGIDDLKSLGVEIVPMQPDFVERMFLMLFDQYSSWRHKLWCSW